MQKRYKANTNSYKKKFKTGANASKTINNVKTKRGGIKL